MTVRPKKKTVDAHRLEVVQSTWVDTLTLAFDRDACIGCDLCRRVCPKEAVSLVVGADGAVPDVDAEACSLCGLCATFCPVGAVRVVAGNTWRDTEEDRRPLLDVGGMPHFSKGMELDASLCPEGCDLCVGACPRNALAPGKTGVSVDRSRCLSCAHCESACPVPGAIRVTRLFEGGVTVDVRGCQPGCDLCARACPTGCYTTLPEAGVAVDSRFCICCGACLVACPHGAIDLTRLKLRSAGDGYSAVWSRAVDRLLSENARFLQQSEKNYLKLTEMLKSSRL
jgi:4Fe-4S ferredoxin